MKKYYFLCLMLLGLSAFAFELSEPIENALKAKQLECIEQKENSIKEVKNDIYRENETNQKETEIKKEIFSKKE